MFCSKCGNHLRQNEAFCPKCGTKPSSASGLGTTKIIVGIVIFSMLLYVLFIILPWLILIGGAVLGATVVWMLLKNKK